MAEYCAEERSSIPCRDIFNTLSFLLSPQYTQLDNEAEEIWMSCRIPYPEMVQDIQRMGNDEKLEQQLTSNQVGYRW